MLELQPAQGRPRFRQRKFGLALAGGGPLGAFYEVGTLHAIGESVAGLDLTNLDMYCGVSSGAMIAAGLANGFDTADTVARARARLVGHDHVVVDLDVFDGSMVEGVRTSRSPAVSPSRIVT